MRKINEVIELLGDNGAGPVILRGDQGRIVVVSPTLVGRVMCSGFEGADKTTRAYILDQQIRDGFSKDGRGDWNNFGGEERLQFAPDGGHFGFFFRPGEEQTLAHHTFPEDVNGGSFRILEKPVDGRSILIGKPVSLTNYLGAHFNLEITRRIEVLDACPFALESGDRVEFTGFESQTTAMNIGAEPMTRRTGGVALWTAGMYEVADHMIVVMPMRPGPIDELGEPVGTRYFKDVCPDGRMPDNYWRVGSDHILIKANGKAQTMIEMWKRRSIGRLGAVDLEDYFMTIVEYGFYPELDYFANYWLPYAGDPFNGSTHSCFVLAGDIGIPLLFELEPCSPALFLRPGERFRHVCRTFHLRGDREALGQICHRSLNVSPEQLAEFDCQS